MATRCPNCPGKYNCVGGTGPDCNNYGTFIGEAPGRDEDRKKEPFVGKTGREVNDHYLPLAGLRRLNVRVLNAIQCLPDTPKHKLDLKKVAHRDLLEACASHHLYPELERTRPNLLVPMGAFACHALDPSITLEMQHGIPVSTKWGTAFPMYHPAGGIHEPKKMLQIRTDWARLRKYLNHSLHLPTDQYPEPDYQECETPEQLDEYLVGQINGPLACDTEITRQRNPYCVTISVRPGTGRLIRAVNLSTLASLQWWLDKWNGVILFHNWLFDGEVVEAMGLNFPWRRIVDTMVKVFHLGNMAQGLKSLAYRELGMTMQDFDDLVTPYSRPIVLDYYRNALCEEWSTPPEQLLRDNDGGYKVYKPQGFRTKLKRFWTDYGKNPEKDVFEQWTKNWEDHQAEVVERCGAWPGKCLTHVPFEKILYYACLSKDSRVSTPDGYQSIGEMVRNHYRGLVHTYNPTTDRIETRPVTGHYKIKQDEKIKWLSLDTNHSRTGRWGTSGTRYTPDHKLLTPQGMRPISELESGDQVYSPVGRLNSIEWQIAYGSLLGDGCVTQRNKGGWANLRFSHNVRQLGYLQWKASLLTNLHHQISEIAPRIVTIGERDCVVQAHFQLSTGQHPELIRLRQESYSSAIRGKSIGPWITQLDSLGLAVWYQDDGTLVGGRYPRLYTLGFTKDHVDWIIRALWANFEIVATSYCTNRPGQWAIQIPAESCKRFYELVAPLTHPTMEYKLPERWRGQFRGVKPVPPEGLVLSTVQTVYSNPPSVGRRGSAHYSYCIDVQETHNFLTMDEVAKNCRDADATLRLWPVIQHMERRVRRVPQEKWRDTAA